MSTPLACVACSLDPQTTSLILPLAQATVVAAPLLLREELRKAVRWLRTRRSSRRLPSIASPGLPEPGRCRPVEPDR
jgi:hypothetical protein